MAAEMKIIENNNRLDSILNRDFVSHMVKEYVEVGKEKFCLPANYKNYEEQVRKFEVQDDDVFLASYPKTGTTWANEMLWMLMNNFDYEGAKEVLQMRSPLLEFSGIIDPDIADMYQYGSIKHAENLKRPRCLKTHVGFSLLPEQIRNGTRKPKIITVLRNAQDVCISQYRHTMAMERYHGTFDDFCDLFLGGRVPFGPFWENVLSYWQQRHNLDILFIKYRDMKNDLPSVIRQVAKFLNKTVTEDEVVKLAQHLSFEGMKKNTAVNFKHMVEKYTSKGDSAEAENSLVRSGKEGGYKTLMSPELIMRFEAWTNEKTSGSGIEL